MAQAEKGARGKLCSDVAAAAELDVLTASAVLLVIPDGWAKIRGQWVRLTDSAQQAAMGKGFWPDQRAGDSRD